MEEIKFRAFDHSTQDYTTESFDSDLDEEQIQKTNIQYLVNTMYWNGPNGSQFSFELFSGIIDV